MKKIRIVLATLVVAALGLSVSAFTVDGYNSNAFTRKCYKLKASVLGASRVIDTDDLNDQVNNTDELAIFTNISNWEEVTAGDPPTPCDEINFVCAICFDETASFLLQEALDKVKDKIEDGTFNFTHLTDVTVADGAVNKVIDVYERLVAP